MSKMADILTAGVNRASDILFVQNPKGTSVGVLSGIALNGVVKFLHPLLNRFKDWIAPDRVNVFYFIAAGMVIFNMPHLFRRRQLPNSIEDAFEVIRRMRKEGASAAQVKLQLLALCNSVVEQVKLDQEKFGGKIRAQSGNFMRERFEVQTYKDKPPNPIG